MNMDIAGQGSFLLAKFFFLEFDQLLFRHFLLLLVFEFRLSKHCLARQRATRERRSVYLDLFQALFFLLDLLFSEHLFQSTEFAVHGRNEIIVDILDLIRCHRCILNGRCNAFDFDSDPNPEYDTQNVKRQRESEKRHPKRC